MKVSVIVSTYNRLDALGAVLQGLSRQQGLSPEEWEVLVADDGSRQETAELVRQWAPCFSCALTHVWHEDAGFRLSAIRNLSSKVATGDWLVFLDGDCVPFPDFVVRQKELAENGWFVAGNRVLLDAAFTSHLNNIDAVGTMLSRSWFWWVYARASGLCNRWFPKLRLSLNGFRKRRPNNWKVLKGCNIGVWKSDFETVNGFDEAFSGWGREDSDFAIRLIRAGVLLKDGRFAVPVLHMWHQENDRSCLQENDRRLADILAGQRVRAVQGFDSYTPEQIGRAILQRFASESA